MLNVAVDSWIFSLSLIHWIYFLVLSVLLVLWIVKPIVFIIKSTIKFLFFVPFAEKLSFLRNSFRVSFYSALYFFRDSVAAPVYVAQSLMLISMFSIFELEKFGIFGAILSLLIIFGSLWAIFRLNRILDLAQQGEKERKRANMWEAYYCDMANHCAELEQELTDRTNDAG